MRSSPFFGISRLRDDAEIVMFWHRVVEKGLASLAPREMLTGIDEGWFRPSPMKKGLLAKDWSLGVCYR